MKIAEDPAGIQIRNVPNTVLEPQPIHQHARCEISNQIWWTESHQVLSDITCKFVHFFSYSVTHFRPTDTTSRELYKGRAA